MSIKKALSRTWSIILSLWPTAATIVAIIGLVDLTHQLIEWAEIVHWIAVKYAVVRSTCFAWVPLIRVPPAWQDLIVLTSILLSVSNVGYYQKTGKFFLPRLILAVLVTGDDTNPLRRDPTLKYFHAAYLPHISTEELAKHLGMSIADSYLLKLGADAAIIPGVGTFAFLLAFFFGWIGKDTFVFGMAGSFIVFSLFVGGVLVAWRWLLSTVFIFLALIAVNEAYVVWFAPNPIPL
jgi:hypothetical protein